MMIEAKDKEFSVVELVRVVINLIRYLLSKWLLIFLVTLFFGVLGILYVWFDKPTYIARLTYVSDNEAGSSLGIYSGLAAQYGLDLGGSSSSAFEGANLMQLLKSRNLVEKTLLSKVNSTTNELIIDSYIKNHQIDKDWKNDSKFSKVKFSNAPDFEDRTADSILYTVYQNIVKTSLRIDRPDSKLKFVEISMEDKNEAFSKRFVEVLAENAIQFYTDYKTGKTKENVTILQHQTDSVRRLLFGNISQVAEMSDLNINPARQIVRTGPQKKQVDVQVNSTVYGELLKNLELARLNLLKETPLIQIIDKPKFPLEKKKKGRLLSGILFAFIGGVGCVLYLILKRWFSTTILPVIPSKTSH